MPMKPSSRTPVSTPTIATALVPLLLPGPEFCADGGGGANPEVCDGVEWWESKGFFLVVGGGGGALLLIVVVDGGEGEELWGGGRVAGGEEIDAGDCGGGAGRGLAGDRDGDGEGNGNGEVELGGAEEESSGGGAGDEDGEGADMAAFKYNYCVVCADWRSYVSCHICIKVGIGNFRHHVVVHSMLGSHAQVWTLSDAKRGNLRWRKSLMSVSPTETNVPSLPTQLPIAKLWCSTLNNPSHTDLVTSYR